MVEVAVVRSSLPNKHNSLLSNTNSVITLKICEEKKNAKNDLFIFRLEGPCERNENDGVGSADIEQHHNQQKEWSELKSRWEQKL